MSELILLVLVLSSIALSVVLSRIAVGEMFRLVRITTRATAPSHVDDHTPVR
jgi:hypothetical protein